MEDSILGTDTGIFMRSTISGSLSRRVMSQDKKGWGQEDHGMK
jgi:hypothetical protein